MMAKLSNKPNGSIDLTRGSLPVLAALTLVCVVAASAYGVGSFVSGLVNDKEQAQEKFASIDRQLGDIKGLIENGNFMRKSEFDLWCRNAEILNRGFKCGNTK